MPISFRELFVTFALIGVFVYAGMSFIINTQTDNDADETILANEYINRTFVATNSSLSGFRSQTQGEKDTFEIENPEPAFGALIIFAIIGVGKTLTGMTMGLYNILIVLPASVLNVPRVVIGVLTSILTVSLILLIWRVYRAGA